MTLVPLPNGDLLVAAADPYLAVLDPDGDARWAQTPRQADFRDQDTTLAVSVDGQTIDFGYERSARRRRDSMSRRDPSGTTCSADDETAPPSMRGCRSRTGHPLPDARWRAAAARPLRDVAQPRHPPQRRPLRPRHRVVAARLRRPGRAALAAGRAGRRLGGQHQRRRPARGRGLRRRHDPLAPHGRRQELLAFFPLADRTNWVAWTPDGFYAATPGAHGVLRWHVNHGWDAPGEAIPVSDIAELRRPEVLPLVLQEMDIVQALGLAELNEARLATQRRLNSAIKPGTQLHVLAVGVGDYNEEKAKHLRLEFADDDAWDVASALFNTQGSLYAKVNPQILRNSEATRAGIFRALDTIQKAMQQDDVAVFHFSGHGALVGDALFLLPYEVDPRDPAGIEGSAVEIGRFERSLCSWPSAAGCWCCWMPVARGRLRRSRQHHGRREPAAHSTGGGQRDRADLVERPGELDRAREVAERGVHRGLSRGARSRRRQRPEQRGQHDRAHPLRDRRRAAPGP